MIMKPDIIYQEQIDRYLLGKASENERSEVDNLILKDSDAKAYYNYMQKSIEPVENQLCPGLGKFSCIFLSPQASS